MEEYPDEPLISLDKPRTCWIYEGGLLEQMCSL